ncbi:hypothetical protein D9M72_635620 [compost metagenome]
MASSQARGMGSGGAGRGGEEVAGAVDGDDQLWLGRVIAQLAPQAPHQHVD